MKFFSFAGLAVVILLFVPNIVFSRIEQHDRPDDVATLSAGICLIEVVSRLALCIVLICVRMSGAHTGFGFPDPGSNVYGIITLVILLFYYLAWWRYYQKGAYYPDIYIGRFLGIPMPMDIGSSLYYIFASLWLNNTIALVLSVIFGICHVGNAIVARQDLKSREEKKKSR